MILTKVTDQTLADLRTMIRREGVSSSKLFLAYPGVPMVDDSALFKALRVARDNGQRLFDQHLDDRPIFRVHAGQRQISCDDAAEG